MALVLIVLMFFLVSARAAVIVALTIPLALLFAFIFLHARGVAANLLSIGAIDFGIIIDGTAGDGREHLPRTGLAGRAGLRSARCHSGRGAAMWTGRSFIPWR